MRITFVMAVADMSGGTKVISLYANRLGKRGHEVHVVSAGNMPPTLRQRLRSLVYERKWLRFTRVPPSHLDGAGVNHKVLERYRPVEDRDVPDADVVVATFWTTAAWVDRLSESKGAKAYFMQDYGAPGMELENLIPTWHLPMHIITISQWLVDLMRSNGVRRPISLVLNSVETEHFNAPPRGKQAVPTVGFLYREEWIKGYDLVLEAYKRARSRHPALRLLTYGPHRPEHPLPQGVDFRLRPPTPALKQIYAACDAWLFASRREGFGLPLLEAMACRTPVIAMPSGAAPDVVARGGGVLVRQDDPVDMADAICRFVEMNELEWRQLSNRAYEAAQGYSWDDAVDRFERALFEVADKKSQEAA